MSVEQRVQHLDQAVDLGGRVVVQEARAHDAVLGIETQRGAQSVRVEVAVADAQLELVRGQCDLARAARGMHEGDGRHPLRVALGRADDAHGGLAAKEGEEALLQMREICPTVRTLLTSGFDESETTRRLADTGVVGFIQTPFSPEQLAEQMRELLLASDD